MNAIPKLTFALVLLIPAMYFTQTSDAQAGGLDCLGCSICPQCDNCCKLSVDQVDADKYCWKVECKQICIPRIVFPWQKKDCCGGCANNGARIKTIKVLKKHAYTCPACEYTWTPKKIGCCGSCCGGNGCGNGCGDVCCDQGCDTDCCAAPMGIEMGLTVPPPVVPAPIPSSDWQPPHPYDQPVHSDPVPSVVAPQPLEAPSAALLPTPKVQAVGFVHELLAQ